MSIKLYQNDIPSNLDLGKIIAIDTETMGLNPIKDRLCLMQISTGNEDVYLVKFEKKISPAINLKKILEDEKVIKIFHYARFDMAMIKYHLKIDVNSVYCTKIASKIIRTYTDRHGLKDLCKELLNVDISKQQQSSDWGREFLSNDQKKYAAQDVLYLHRIKDILDEMLIRENRIEIANECHKFLSTQVKLDLLGWNDTNIFSH
ncbi:MAG: ribonuclease D [Rhodobiaceae bacterium]|jgi:ribonuclease D|nr:ribonuclease D [Rhodobiaceae bacterium]MBT5640267.1 ribonuclease D [Rhodobiaceae bacterium]MBT6222785.1 ribonuclease D [Rhodobiaceae bacterium]